jgi:hypothetical protein
MTICFPQEIIPEFGIAFFSFPVFAGSRPFWDGTGFFRLAGNRRKHLLNRETAERPSQRRIYNEKIHE